MRALTYRLRPVHAQIVFVNLYRPHACSAVWLAVGLWVLLMPASVGARPLSRVAPFAAAFLLAWLLAAYAATSVAPVIGVPAVAQCAA